MGMTSNIFDRDNLHASPETRELLKGLIEDAPENAGGDLLIFSQADSADSIDKKVRSFLDKEGVNLPEEEIQIIVESTVNKLKDPEAGASVRPLYEGQNLRGGERVTLDDPSQKKGIMTIPYDPDISSEVLSERLSGVYTESPNLPVDGRQLLQHIIDHESGHLKHVKIDPNERSRMNGLQLEVDADQHAKNIAVERWGSEGAEKVIDTMQNARDIGGMIYSSKHHATGPKLADHEPGENVGSDVPTLGGLIAETNDTADYPDSLAIVRQNIIQYNAEELGVGYMESHQALIDDPSLTYVTVKKMQSEGHVAFNNNPIGGQYAQRYVDAMESNAPSLTGLGDERKLSPTDPEEIKVAAAADIGLEAGNAPDLSLAQNQTPVAPAMDNGLAGTTPSIPMPEMSF